MCKVFISECSVRHCTQQMQLNFSGLLPGSGYLKPSLSIDDLILSRSADDFKITKWIYILRINLNQFLGVPYLLMLAMSQSFVCYFLLKTYFSLRGSQIVSTGLANPRYPSFSFFLFSFFLTFNHELVCFFSLTHKFNSLSKYFLMRIMLFLIYFRIQLFVSLSDYLGICSVSGSNCAANITYEKFLSCVYSCFSFFWQYLDKNIGKCIF